ncbi:MAG: tRNA (N(6)-L-threonylcarbamoyladenosine(37)-C(2))-methylthiotransferase MtaB [Candidatus Acetothermia bacterium]|nr:tRNA (N(6)-L-threonylcarbamoyladenosine(37)-C(2))-methylthiotransferase MtaB [Candidatus Acetothermia bacterium]
MAWRTLGCRVNQYDTELMKARLAGQFEVVSDGAEAEVYILNTCTVTSRAEAKARQYIHSLGRRGLVLVTGCWATVAPEEVAKIPGVRLVFPNSGKLQVEKLVQTALTGGGGIVRPSPDGASLDEERIATDLAHTRAFVKVQDGCDRFCTFCRTVFARGRSRSKSPQAVLAEVSRLVENGFVEIVLTGIDLASFGSENGASLAGLLWQLAEIPGLRRIRLSSLNPQGISPELLQFFRECDKGCPYFHLPLQSGDDLILRRMNRGYSVAEYREKVDLIREMLPQATWGADVMVGFPGETEEQFLRTCRLLEELAPLRLHIFRYSRRPGTAAARFPEQVPERIKLERAARLRRLGEELSLRVKQRYIGQRLKVLVEERGADGLWRGWAENYIEVGILPRGGRELEAGEIVPVRIRKVAADRLLGEVT